MTQKKVRIIRDKRVLIEAFYSDRNVGNFWWLNPSIIPHFDEPKINRKNRDRPGGHVNQGYFNHVLLDYVDNYRWSKNLMRRHERREGKADLCQRVDEYHIGVQIDFEEEADAEWAEFQEWLEFQVDEIEDDYDPDWDIEYGYDDWDIEYGYDDWEDEHDGYGFPDDDPLYGVPGPDLYIAQTQTFADLKTYQEGQTLGDILDAALNPNKYGKRNVPKMINQINELRFLIRQEGTPAIQEAWDKVEEHIDFAYRLL